MSFVFKIPKKIDDVYSTRGTLYRHIEAKPGHVIKLSKNTILNSVEVYGISNSCFDLIDVPILDNNKIKLSSCYNDYVIKFEEYVPINILSKKFPLVCPETGLFIGYKKVFVKEINLDIYGTTHVNYSPAVAKLEIPIDAKRSSAYGRKCRCNKANVIDITDYDQTRQHYEAYSNYDPNFKYEVGKAVMVENFDENRWDECSRGIHFFMTREEAVYYML